MSNTALYFIAIVLPEPILSDLLAIKEEFRERFGCKVALKSPAHITLWPPMNFPTEVVEQITTVLHTISAAQKPFSISLKNFDSFPPRVIFVAVEENPELKNLQLRLSDALCTAIPALEQKRDTRPFHPHATVANRDLEKNDFKIAWDDFSKRRYAATAEAKSITLLRHNGERWEEAEHFGLKG
jgi:2'-5' RNA ligase